MRVVFAIAMFLGRKRRVVGELAFLDIVVLLCILYDWLKNIILEFLSIFHRHICNLIQIR